MESKVCALLLLLLCGAICTEAVPVDCCLSVVNQRLPSKSVESYFIQEAGNGCNISATVFTVKGGRRLCVPHPEGHPWVHRLIKVLEQRKAKS